MNAYLKMLTWILGVIAVFVLEITVINLISGETYLLLMYDLKNQFADNLIYAMSLVILAFVDTGGGYVICLLCKRVSADWLKTFNVQVIIDGICIIVIVIGLYINNSSFYRDLSQGTWEQTKTIGHSFGAINNDNYTGSLEAFEYNYTLGRRTMEVDLILTTDDQLVLKHDWDTPVQDGISEAFPPDKEQFLNAKLLGKYTPLSFEQLCGIMIKYPDLWIVTDTKSTENEEIYRQFMVMVDTTQQLGCEEILDRIIVQVYNEEMYEIVNGIYHFDNYIFTMYWRFYNDDWLGITRDVCRFCVNNGIETIAIGTNRISPEMKAIADRYERNVYIHTVNDMEEADKYFKMGVNGIYTDIITDRDL